jgi:hypothetical protein
MCVRVKRSTLAAKAIWPLFPRRVIARGCNDPGGAGQKSVALGVCPWVLVQGVDCWGTMLRNMGCHRWALWWVPRPSSAAERRMHGSGTGTIGHYVLVAPSMQPARLHTTVHLGVFLVLLIVCNYCSFFFLSLGLAYIYGTGCYSTNSSDDFDYHFIVFKRNTSMCLS